MKRMGMLIRGLLQDIASGDESIVNRTQHMLNKSRRSLHNTLQSGTDDNPMMNDSAGRRSGRKSERFQQSGVSAMMTKSFSSVRAPAQLGIPPRNY